MRVTDSVVWTFLILEAATDLRQTGSIDSGFTESVVKSIRFRKPVRVGIRHSGISIFQGCQSPTPGLKLANAFSVLKLPPQPIIS
jgi:hypothetical protein